MILYECVCQDNPTAGKLQQLCVYLDHQDVWYELFHWGCNSCSKEFGWLQMLVGSEIDFKWIMKSLLAYSLIESYHDWESYCMHLVVHDWCVETFWAPQCRAIWRPSTGFWSSDCSPTLTDVYSRLMTWKACIGLNQRKLSTHSTTWATSTLIKASTRRYEKAWCQGKHTEAEEIYQRALDGKEKAWGPDHTSTLDTVNNLGNLYSSKCFRVVIAYYKYLILIKFDVCIEL